MNGYLFTPYSMYLINTDLGILGNYNLLYELSRVRTSLGIPIEQFKSSDIS